MAELSDEEIMQRIKEDHLEDLAILFDRYHLKMYNFFLKLTFNKTKSQDLTQNLFYRIIKFRQSFKYQEGSFKYWIYKIARNLHIDSCKEEKKHNSHFTNVENYNENIAGQEESFREEDYSNLDKALMKLNPEQLEIIVLGRFQGLKYEEISKLKEIPVSSIKVQMHRAVKQLKEIFFNQF